MKGLLAKKSQLSLIINEIHCNFSFGEHHDLMRLRKI